MHSLWEPYFRKEGIVQGAIYPFEFDKPVTTCLTPQWARKVVKKEGRLTQEVIDPPKYYIIKPSTCIEIVRKEMKWE